MISQRRFGPLIALVLAALAVVYARMAQVQIGEHEIWAREAANLVRTSETLPYHRGRILDRKGRVLVQDDDAYEVELGYRNFRRDHPLGQVAHARAALEMSSVSLHRAALELADWGLELVRLAPASIERFARGGALELESLVLPAAADPERELRRSRASELRYYVQELLEIEGKELAELRKRVAGGDDEQSYLELAAAVRGLDPADLGRELADRLRASVGRLEQLAWLLALDDETDAPPFSRGEALARLLEQLERTRDRVDDEIASELFELAAGFAPARVRPELLLGHFDLAWLSDSLRWSEERTERWAAAERAAFESNLRTLFVEGATIRATLGAGVGSLADRLLDQYAALYDAPHQDVPGTRRVAASWRGIDELVVFSALDEHFDGSPERERAPPIVLPFQEPELRAKADGERWDVLAAAVIDPGASYVPEGGWNDGSWIPPRSRAEAAERLRRCTSPGRGGSRPSAEDRRELPAWFVLGWELRFQERLAAALADLGRDAGEARLELKPGRRERALEQLAYVVRDRGSRPVTIDPRPSYEVVQLLTRHPEEYSGFAVRRTTRRRAIASHADGQPIAPDLIGVVRESSLREVIEQREYERRLADLRRKPVRSAGDEDEMRGLVAQLYRNDEVHGSSGIEGLYDELLRGENGYREREGLQERAGERRDSFFKPPVDGRDLRLALDLELQAAATRTLEHPVLPPDETERDLDWFDAPVGAIVLITPAGEVLAATSVPREPGEPRPGRDDQRARPLERTLRMHTFQPVGSVFKPFVALWSLDRMGLDPAEELACEALAGRGGAGYGAVRCHKRIGHGRVALRTALQQSCNAYFAQLGERFGSKEAMLEMAVVFGFGEPTGLARTGLGTGLVEDSAMPAAKRFASFRAPQLQQAANGLAVIEGTPLQVARAFAALATGALPELRFDLAADARSTPSARPLPFSSASLALVRKALVDVVRIGSAAGKGLGSDDLGFQLAAKTGSADYLPMNDEVRAGVVATAELPDVRKHTWLAGWFPAEDPVAVLVVYLHDVAFTSSHTAVHVASQFLRSPEVQAFVREERR